MGIINNQRVIRKSAVLNGIFYDKKVVILNSVSAERYISRSFCRLDAAPGFKPLPVFVNKAYEGYRHLKFQLCLPRNAIKTLFSTGIKDIEALQGLQALRFVVWLSG